VACISDGTPVTLSITQTVLRRIQAPSAKIQLVKHLLHNSQEKKKTSEPLFSFQHKHSPWVFTASNSSLLRIDSLGVITNNN
jgi:hypothetical protein